MENSKAYIGGESAMGQMSVSQPLDEGRLTECLHNIKSQLRNTNAPSHFHESMAENFRVVKSAVEGYFRLGRALGDAHERRHMAEEKAAHFEKDLVRQDNLKKQIRMLLEGQVEGDEETCEKAFLHSINLLLGFDFADAEERGRKVFRERDRQTAEARKLAKKDKGPGLIADAPQNNQAAADTRNSAVGGVAKS